MMFSKTTLIAGLCAAGAATAVAASRPGAAARADVFASWMSEHGKSYFSKEELILRREFSLPSDTQQIGLAASRNSSRHGRLRLRLRLPSRDGRTNSTH